MKKHFFTIIQVCLIIFAIGGWQANLFAQTPFTITWTGLQGATNATGVPAGITIVQQYNGVVGACATSPNGASTTYSGVIQANAGYVVTITSIGGTAYASSAGSRNFKFQLTNGDTYIQAAYTSLPGSSNCSGNTTISPFAIPAEGQVLNPGNQATVTVLRDKGSASGGGYSYTRSLTITGTIEPLAVNCDIPANLAENNVTANEADFNWDADGTNDFEYVLSQSATAPTGSGTAINGTSYSTSSLSPSTDYYFYVRQNCGGGNYSAWTMVNFTTLPLPCTTVTNLVSSNVDHESADLSWNASTGNTFEYVLDENTMAPTGSGIAITTITHEAAGLEASTTYYFHIRKDCGNGNYSAWETISFTTSVEPCLIVENITSSNVDHESADLSWDASTGNTFEYVLDENNAAPTGSGTATSDVTYEATGLEASTTYYFHIRKDCGNGNYSAWETISFTTSVEPCLIVENITSSNVDHESADLSWNASTGNTFEYVLDENNAAPTGSGIATTTITHEAAGLEASTTYYFHIRKDCGNGNYSAWETISFTTSVEPCLIVENITSSNVDHESADLSWDASTGNTFEYVLDENNAAPTGSGVATSDVTYEATGLEASTTYYFHIRKDCGNGNYSAWEAISFTTSVEPCLIVENITSSNVDHESADLSWNASTGNTFEYVLDENTMAPTGSGIATTTITHEATGLEASTTYYFHIRKDCGNGNYSAWETISFTTSVELCLIVENITSSNVDHESADLSWDASAGNTFEYVLNETATIPTGSGTVTTTSAYTAENLEEATIYYFHIRKDCGNGNYSEWETVSFTTSSTVGIEGKAMINFTVYPNPAVDQVVIQTEKMKGTVKLINVNGQQLQQIDLSETATLNLFELNSGIYFVVYELNENKAVEKLIVQ